MGIETCLLAKRIRKSSNYCLQLSLKREDFQFCIFGFFKFLAWFFCFSNVMASSFFFQFLAFGFQFSVQIQEVFPIPCTVEVQQ